MSAKFLYGSKRDQLVQSLKLFGTHLGREDFGEVWVQDGVVWLIDACQAQNLGDYASYMYRVQRHLRRLYPVKEPR